MVLERADECKEEYDEWIAVLGTRVVNLDLARSTTTTSTLANSADNIELQRLPVVVSSANLTERERATPEPIRVPPSYSTLQSPSFPLARPLPPARVTMLRDAWYRYLDSRVMEWKIAGTTACVFVAALIAFVLAIFAFIWRTGSVDDPSAGRPPMSIDLALALRIIITSITFIDVGCLVWIWRRLTGYSQRVWRDENGGDGFPPTPRSQGRFGNLTP
ncbi:hypothetical protein C0995_001375 [Termitomyces sp. Mi166|nr:hypothetical protein C0995_001375 [Termitomyces sp. Mi166\